MRARSKLYNFQIKQMYKKPILGGVQTVIFVEAHHFVRKRALAISSNAGQTALLFCPLTRTGMPRQPEGARFLACNSVIAPSPVLATMGCERLSIHFEQL